MVSPNNPLLKYGNYATQPAVAPAAGVNVATLDPLVKEAYTDYLKTAAGIRKKVKPSESNILANVDLLADLNKPVPKKPGLLQQLLGNKVTQTVLAPLQVIDIPRRAIISGAKELYDVGAGQGASFQDFAEQVKDPTFGVGRFVNTGNRNLDRLLGFTGDVLADPTTYLTLGAGKFAGAAGRLALAKELAAKGASEAIVQRAGIRGLTGLKAAERAAYDLPRAGLYLGGAQGIRLPGTEVVGEVLGRGLSKTRAGLGATKVGTAVRKARSDERLLDITEKLLAGKGPVASATAAAKVYGGLTERKGVEGLTLAQLRQDFLQVADTIRSADGPAVTRAVEKGATDSSPAASAVKGLFDNWFNRMETAGVQVQRLSGDNYVPHVWTDKGRALFASTDKFAEDARKLFGVTVNELRAPSAVRHRVFRVEPGKLYEIGGKQLSFADNTVDEINRVFMREFGVKVLEDDIGILIDKYANNVARAIGNQKFATALADAGLGGQIDNLSADVVDKAATEARDEAWKKANKKVIDQASKDRKVAKAQYDSLVKPYTDSLAAFKGKVKDILKQRKVTLQGDLKNVIADVTKFVSENQKKQFDLATQAKLLDEAIVRTERAIDVATTAEAEAVRRASMVSGREGLDPMLFPDVAPIVREREVADAVLAELKAARNQLDVVTRQLEDTLVQLPVKSQLPEDAQKALTRRNAVVEIDDNGNPVVSKAAEPLPEPKVEPFQMVGGNAEEYNVRNAYSQFRQTYFDGKEVAGKFSPEAEQLVDTARKTYDEMLELDRKYKLLISDIDSIGNVQVAYDATKKRYDYIYNALVGRVDRKINDAASKAVGRMRAIRFGTAAGAEFPTKYAVSAKTLAPLIEDMASGDVQRVAAAFDSMSATMRKRVFGSEAEAAKFAKLIESRKAMQYGELWGLGPELKGLISRNGGAVIRRFETDLIPAYQNMDSIYNRRNALMEEFNVSSVESLEAVINDGYRRAKGLIEQARSRAEFEFVKSIDSPVLGQNLKNAMIAEYRDFFTKFVNSLDVMRRINTKQTLTDETARAWAKEAVAAKEGMDEAVTKVRIHADFANRYKNVAQIMDARGLPYDRDGLGALVAKEVLATEIANLRSAKETLVTAQSRAIQEGVDAFRRESRKGAIPKLAEIKLGVAESLEAKTNMVETLVDEWLKIRRELGDVTRTSTLKLTKEQQAQKNALEAAVKKAKTPKEQAAASKALVDFNAKYKKSIDVRGVSAEEATALGLNYNQVAGLGLNVPGPGSSAALRKELKDVENLIVKAIFGEESVRPEGYSFAEFIKSVTGISKDEGNVRRVNRVELDSWVNNNGLPEISKRDVGTFRAMMEKDPKTGAYRTRRAKSGQESKTATVAKSIQDQIDVVDQRIGNLSSAARLLGLEPKLPKASQEMMAKFPELFEFSRIADDPIAMSEKLAELEIRRNELKPRALPSNTKAGFPQPVGLIESAENRIVEIEKQMSEAGVKVRYQPTAADENRIDELHRTIDFLDIIVGNKPMNYSGVVASREFPTTPRVSGQALADAQSSLGGAIEELTDLVARSYKWGGKEADEEILGLFEELKQLKADRDSMVLELNRIGDSKSGEIAYWRAKMKYGATNIKPKAGYSVANWQGVLFADTLGKAKRASRAFLRDRLELLAQEAKAQQVLRLPNQSVLEGRMVQLSEAIERNGGVAVINRRATELEKFLKDVDAAIADVAGDENKVSTLGMNLAELRRERKAIDAELKKNKTLRDAISKRTQIEADITVGPIPGAQARVDELNRTLTPIESVQYVAGQQLEAAAFPPESQIGNQAVDFYKGEQARVNAEIDNTRRIGEDGAQALLDSKVAVEAEIRNLADELALADAAPSFGGVGAAKVRGRVDEIHMWMDNAYALVDPEGYASRVAKTPPVDRYGPPSVADELAAIGMEPATPETTATLALYGQAAKAEAELLQAGENVMRLDEMIKGVKNLPAFGSVMKKQIQDGFVELQGTGIAVTKEVNDMLERVMRLDDPNRWGDFVNAWDGMNDLFKSYATMSPRFHIRNALSATLMNYADGVATRDIIDGQKYWRLFKNNPNKWFEQIPANRRQEIVDAVMAVFGSGGGRYSEFKTGSAWGTRNAVVKASQDIGTSVEGAVRLGMALNTIRGGGSIDEAVARITRIHFDYSQLSTADKYARRIIPFWTFMSRNIPLQMQQIWMKPRVYQMYASAVRNFQGEPTGEVVPSWYQEQGIFKSPVGEGYIKPDLAWTGLPGQVRQATTAAGLLSQATPYARVPLELLAGKKFFSGAPIREGEQLGYAAESLLPLYNTIRGLAGMKGGAQPYMSEQAQQAASQSQGEAQLNSILSFLGSPYMTGPTVSQQRSEILRRKALMEELARMVGNK